MAMYFKDRKNKVIEIRPNMLRISSSVFLWPKGEILFFSRKGIVKNRDPKDRKNTI
jgi:hypothetical protein